MGTFNPAILVEINALITTLDNIVFPAIHVIPNNFFPCFLIRLAAMMIHNASSAPTSQSMMKYSHEGMLN